MYQATFSDGHIYYFCNHHAEAGQYDIAKMQGATITDSGEPESVGLSEKEICLCCIKEHKTKQRTGKQVTITGDFFE